MARVAAVQRSSQAGARTSRALFRPAGRDSSGADPVLITPESAGWSFAGLRVVRLAPGASRSLDTGPDEMLVLPLAGVVLLVIGAHVVSQQREGVPAKRRRIRTASGLLMMIVTTLLAWALAIQPLPENAASLDR